jgi:RsiW-degrading membrane proteinase PrsW (M82 family)
MALLIVISALPVLAVFIWFKAARYPLSLIWFLAALLGGAAAIPIAALLQSLFPALPGADLGTLLFRLFVQIALTEETGRLLVLILLSAVMKRFAALPGPYPEPPESRTSRSAALGLLTGLGFAVIETAFYGIVDFKVALLRAFTAAPLHGACGSRVGITVANIRTESAPAIRHFLAAVAIHGMYNFMVINPSLPAFFPIILVFITLASTLRIIQRDGREEAGKGTP